ncbi:MAG: ATP-binding protein [Gammaproteobacteria bacterium]|jgi:tRNA(Ile)-lysidine synthase TilS/MesJ
MVDPVKATTITPPKALLRPVGRAIADYNMVKPGDKVLVAVSGGKDSLTMLHVLLHLKRHAPVDFDVAAITVDPQVEGYDPSHLRDYMPSLGVKYFYQSQPIMQRAVDHMGKSSYCSFCSRMKRGIMYATARREGYNVLALGQHLDDLAESFLMSAFHGGQLRTMKAHYVNDDGDLRVIRPLIYTRERQTAAYAKECSLPVIPDSCPACFEMPTQRQHMKELLAAEEKNNRNLFKNLLTTMRPLLNQDYYVRASDVKIK